MVCSSEVRSHALGPHPIGLDLLIVVDRSASMADAGPGLGSLVQGIVDASAGLDLNVAVVTSDLGGPGVTGCRDRGDDAQLQRAPACGVAGTFVRTGSPRDPARADNVDGDLRDALACMLDLPRSACPVSQPLAAAAAALARPGFRRPDAALQVAIVTDSDDCSLVARDALIATGLPLDTEAAVDRACFTAGAQCAQDATAPGLHTGCVPRADRGLADPIATRDALAARDGFRVGSLTAGAEVRVDDGGGLASACADGRSTVGAPRLEALTTPEGHFTADGCGDDWRALAVGSRPRPLFQAGGCLVPSADWAPTVPGAQVRCAAELERVWNDGAETREVLPMCGAEGPVATGSCLRVGELGTPRCPAGIEVQIETDWLGPTWASVACEAPCE